MRRSGTRASIPLHRPFFRGARRLRVALVGLPDAGKSAIFRAVESTAVRPGAGECDVEVALDQALLIHLPGMGGLQAATPDVVVQVIDATELEPHLALTLELLQQGRPLVIAMNKMDLAREQGRHIAARALARRLGVPVVPTVATMGYGIRELFAAVVQAARRGAPPATGHSAASLAETAARPAGMRERRDWRYWLDELFLSPRWGLAGSAVVFAAVLFVLFEVSARLDALTAARLVAAIAAWQPQTTQGVVLRAVADGLIGLAGIVVPYMIPLLLLLITLQQTGIMARIAFAVDRGFHRVGLHGGVALPLLLGLGCNVPALSAIGATTRGNERTIASLLVTFVPCSARTAIILALAGKYLGAWGVLAVFAVTALAIGIVGRLLRGHYAAGSPGQIQEIPPYALPRWRSLAAGTWLHARDVLTIVAPLLVGGSVLLALLHHVGADRAINLLLAPVTQWWLGLPMALGVPLLFGILRKELSLLMVFQALGGFEVDAYLSHAQIFTFVVFVTLYVPCVSTFAVMLKTLGGRRALLSVGLSIGVALAASGAVRLALQLGQLLAA